MHLRMQVKHLFAYTHTPQKSPLLPHHRLLPSSLSRRLHRRRRNQVKVQSPAGPAWSMSHGIRRTNGKPLFVKTTRLGRSKRHFLPSRSKSLLSFPSCARMHEDVPPPIARHRLSSDIMNARVNSLTLSSVRVTSDKVFYHYFFC